jgi:inhibitor of cysteine peptidase
MQQLARLKAIVLILVVVLWNPGARPAFAAPQGAPQPIKLTDADDNKLIEATVGQPIEIRLQANPTTGYLWLLQPFPKFLELSDFSYDKTGKPMPGSGGTQTVNFIAKSLGTGEVKFDYRRIWEKADIPAAKTFTVKITVR